MPRDPPTRYPFPPQDIYRHFPDAAPWDEPISQLAALLVMAVCETCGTVKYPLRRMAAEIGWKRTLRPIVPKLQCKRCGSRPISIALVPLNGDDRADRRGKRQEIELLHG